MLASKLRRDYIAQRSCDRTVENLQDCEPDARLLDSPA